ncbi:MAG TPA: PaaI family thioesterase [Terriglobales bacterium]|nr:PaaI family thioesterase [Terriglobales bacterium]
MAKKKSGAGHGTKAHPLTKNFCFGCGRDNSHGMHLKFFLDDERQQVVSNFRLSRRYTGPPGYCHGGIIATILDEAMSKLSKLREVIAPTSQMKVEYLRPVPLRKPLRVESRELAKRGRRLIRTAQIVDDKGTVLARARGVFVIIDPHRVFLRRA